MQFQIMHKNYQNFDPCKPPISGWLLDYNIYYVTHAFSFSYILQLSREKSIQRLPMHKKLSSTIYLNLKILITDDRSDPEVMEVEFNNDKFICKFSGAILF